MKRIISVLALMLIVFVLSPISPAREPRPHIHAALDALHEARNQLQAAAHDYHGHRAEALKHVDEAIREAEICMHER